MTFDKCPVCGEKGPIDEGIICPACFWEMCQLASAKPDKCFGGPNFLPLEAAKARWLAGIRDHGDLSRCPWDLKCEDCPNDGLKEGGKE